MPSAHVVTAEHLRAAADLVGSFGDDETRIGEYGLPVEALKEFVEESTWRDIDERGPVRDVDPLALAIGVSIGFIVGHDYVSHRNHEGRDDG